MINVAGLPCAPIRPHDGAPVYYERHELMRGPGLTATIHHWTGDDGRGELLHAHPWPNVTTVLAGVVVEHTDGGSQLLEAGAVVARPAGRRHRIELITDDAWTLFVHGPEEQP